MTGLMLPWMMGAAFHTRWARPCIGRKAREQFAQALAHPVGGAGMVAIGDEDLRHALSGEPIENLVAGIDGVDTEVSLRAEEQGAVEIVTVGLRKPGPDGDAGQKLAHRPGLHLRPSWENLPLPMGPVWEERLAYLRIGPASGRGRGRYSRRRAVG